MNAKTTALGIACALTAAPALAFTTQMQIQSGTLPQVYQIQKQEEAIYWRQVEEIVAGRLRRLRVAEEHTAATAAGHPVKLPTGHCQAIAVIQADGTVTRSELGQCRHRAIGDDLLKALQQSSPLPPFGRPINMTVTVNANESYPGKYGN